MTRLGSENDNCLRKNVCITFVNFRLHKNVVSNSRICAIDEVLNYIQIGSCWTKCNCRWIFVERYCFMCSRSIAAMILFSETLVTVNVGYDIYWWDIWAGPEGRCEWRCRKAKCIGRSAKRNCGKRANRFLARELLGIVYGMWPADDTGKLYWNQWKNLTNLRHDQNIRPSYT